MFIEVVCVDYKAPVKDTHCVEMKLVKHKTKLIFSGNFETIS